MSHQSFNDRHGLGSQQCRLPAGIAIRLSESRRLTITPIDAFADGSTSQDGVPVDTRANLHGLINTISFYATDTLSVGKSLALTFPAVTTGPQSKTRIACRLIQRAPAAL